METEVGWKMGGRKRRGDGREGKKRKTFLRPCSAETRFQGIATIGDFFDLSNKWDLGNLQC